MKATKKYQYVVVFDGTSSYVISVNDLLNEIEENEVEVLEYFNNFQSACDYSDNINENEI